MSTNRSTVEDTPTAPAEPIATHEIRGGRGVRLHAREWGNPSGPAILFIHGWSQSDLCWTKQTSGRLADRYRIVTFDLRGHGLSQKPSDPDNYTDARCWADDLAAVIDQTNLTRPVLVAWSYGGYVVTDYLRAYGDAAIGGIVLVGAAVLLKRPTFDHIGTGLLDNAQGMCAPDLSANIAALRRFVRACTAQPLAEHDSMTAMCSNMIVPPDVRSALFARDIDGVDALAHVDVPVLVAHGRADTIVLPSMSERTISRCRTAIPSWYDDVGHMPFWEATERFDRELGEFVDRART